VTELNKQTNTLMLAQEYKRNSWTKETAQFTKSKDKKNSFKDGKRYSNF
jgi:hypothetical protein